ncbi:ABC transporter permease [Haloferax volcanii]|uniref:Sugar ABC transporter permease n=3 Tax=Haloferax volcanii TaxID=2246 RepID=A0A384L3W8_HALVD|nr:ABC transporter permease [Haloferax volcanii]ADE02541.1 ABC-type transport system permease protein (probable substrate sugar) [Haloferax volcanii DS2]ELY34548.1 sugar ABC transporter permease [Haloferax volcanii DS2]MBS8119878.1 ABC transporter permease [Haloferax volcanii]MBS8124916.1 ABC transporter permease [Haloferax volcanii]MBS8128413.1 ABC transporter permease [Haloferax volcanii]
MSDAATGVRSLADRIAARMLDASVLERVVIALVATALALLIGAVIVAASGYDAVEFVSSLVYGAVGNVSNLAFMLRQSSMLILTGVAVAVAFRAGVFNIGVQGQFVVGGFAATLGILFAAPLLPNSPVSAIPLLALATLLALAAGGAYGALPGVMKAYAGANEVITTIMLNFIASGVVYFLLDAYLRPEGAAAPNTEQFPDYVGLPGLVFESPSFSILGLGVALLTVVVVYLVMDRTGFGYDLVTSGYQEPAAKYSGVDPKRMIVRTMTISGMIAGLAGALFAIMILGYYSDPNTFPTFGFDAIAVSLLAANNPLGVVPAGLLFGGLDAGGQYIGFTLDVPSELVDGVIGLIVLFVAAPELFRAAGQHTSLGGDRE